MAIRNLDYGMTLNGDLIVPSYNLTIGGTSILTGNVTMGGTLDVAGQLDIGSTISLVPNTGMITATSFAGDGSLLTNLSSANIAGVVFIDGTRAMTGTLTINRVNAHIQLQEAGVSKWHLESSAGAFKIVQTGVATKLTFDTGGNATFANNLTTSGNLVVNGTGTHTFAGNITASGKTITAGTINATANLQENGTNLSAKYLGISAKAVDSDKLDNLDSTSFMRTDANTSTSGTLTVNGQVTINNDLTSNTLSQRGFKLLDLRSTNPEIGAAFFNPIALAVRGTKGLYKDEDFAVGINGISKYNNVAGSTDLVHTWIDMDTAPNKSKKVIEIKHVGINTTPNLGGFIHKIDARVNAVFVQMFRAKIPVGYQVNAAANAMGTDYSDYWMSNIAGTGKWETYVRVTVCGNTGTFSNGGHVYLSKTTGPDPTPTAPVIWYLASSNVFDVSYLEPSDINGLVAGTFTKVTVDSMGRVTTGTTLQATDIPNLDWSKIISGKPTTLGGYGITDAMPNNANASTTGNLTVSGGTLTLNNATSNVLVFNNIGVAAPTAIGGTGMKINLSGGEYGIGIETNSVWYTTDTNHKWYSQNGGTSVPVNVMTLDGTGNLTISGNLVVSGTGTHTFAGNITATGKVITAGTVNATSNLQENGTNLSAKYLALAGNTMTGDINFTMVENAVTKGISWSGVTDKFSIYAEEYNASVTESSRLVIHLEDNATTDYIVFNGRDSTAGNKDLFEIWYNNVNSLVKLNAKAGLDVVGDITVSGNVDGVDIAAFKTAYDSHKHDSLYSPIGHNHDTVYAPIVHNHDSSYAALDHNHDTLYAALTHNHDSVYAPISHTHPYLSNTAPHVGLDVTGNATYARLVLNNNPGTNAVYLRANDNTGGFLPYSDANSYLGTSAFKFKEVHGVTLYQNGTALSSIYAPLTRSIATGNGLSGGGNLSADRTISVSYGGNGTATTVARSDHNHDTVYAALGHNHDSVYASISHNHDLVYAPLSHTHNASDINAGTLADARLNKSPAAYAINPLIPDSSTEFHSSLSNPTIGGLALNDDYVFDVLQFRKPTSIETTTDGTAWTAYTTAEIDAVREVWSGKTGGSIVMKNASNNSGAAMTALRITWDKNTYGSLYVWLKYLYMYYSMNGHTMSVKIQKSQDAITWTDVHTSSNVGGWPSHIMVSHPVIYWATNQSTTHHQYARIVFTPVWNATYPNSNISIDMMKWYCTFPAFGGIPLYTWNFDRNVWFAGAKLYINNNEAWHSGNFNPATKADATHNHDSVYEPIFTKNTAFNKNFGTAAGTVAQGNHNHDTVYAAINHNHDTVYAPISHTHPYLSNTIAYVGLDAAGSATYPRLVFNNNPVANAVYVRANDNTGGFLPYSNANSYIGTASWKFKEIHGVTLYQNGTALSSIYSPLTRKVLTGNGLTGGGDLSADRTISVSYGGNGTALTVSRSDHDHAGVYSPVAHNHDSAYAAITHNHDTVYAPLVHNHDGTYAPASHNHDTVYEPIFTKNTAFNKNFGSVAGTVAEGNHNHDAAYAAKTHNHDTVYAAINHNHDTVYAPISHTHPYLSNTVAYVGLDATGSATYPRLVFNNSPIANAVYVRANDNTGGFLPYSNGNSYIGTSAWKFKEIHGVTFYENGTALGSIYTPLTRSITAGNGLTGGGDLSANRTISVSYGGTGTATTVARSDHNHSSVYSPIDHNHDSAYAPITHNHDTVYAPMVHNHDGTYAPVVHNHDGVYEPVFTKNTGFNKNFGTAAGTVAEGNHTHDGRYYTEAEMDTKLGEKVTKKTIQFTVAGDAATYYPVLIEGIGGSFAEKKSEHTIDLHRAYSWQAPDTWNTATHKGGLQLVIDYHLSGWGGQEYYFYTRIAQSYTRIVADITCPNPDTDSILVWLRGGTALYELTATAPGVTATVYLGDYVNMPGTQYATTYPPKTVVESAFNFISTTREFRSSPDFYVGGGFRNIKAGYKVWHAGSFDPATKVDTSRQVIAGSGLTGGGTLAADRTLSISFSGSGTATTASRSDHVHSNYLSSGTNNQSVGTGFTVNGTMYVGVGPSTAGDIIIKNAAGLNTIHFDGDSSGKIDATNVKSYINGNGDADLRGTVLINELQVTSNTLVQNLNAEYVGGYKANAFMTTDSIMDAMGYGVHKGMETIAQSVPNMTVLVKAGTVYTTSGRRYVYQDSSVALQNSSTIYDRIDVVYVRGASAGLNEGQIFVQTGVPATPATEPAIPSDAVKLATVHVRQNIGSITDGTDGTYNAITDARQWRPINWDHTNKIISIGGKIKEDGVLLESKYAQLGAANVFTANQKIVTATDASLTIESSVQNDEAKSPYIYIKEGSDFGFQIKYGSNSNKLMFTSVNGTTITERVSIERDTGKLTANNDMQVNGKLIAKKNATTVTIAAGQTSAKWTHNYGATTYAVNPVSNSFARHVRWDLKNANDVTVYIDDPHDEDILVDIILMGY